MKHIYIFQSIMARTIGVSLLVLLSCVTMVTMVSGDEVRSALVIIDVQNCFTAGGTLAVGDGDAVIPVINRLREDLDPFFNLVVMSQDWHCQDHVSFASQHPGYPLYSLKGLQYNEKGDDHYKYYIHYVK